MNANQVRVVFIKRQLAGVLRDRDRGKMKRTAREFGKYLRWCGESLSRPDRKSIARLLWRLHHMTTG